MGQDANEQAVEFFIKRAELSATTAAHHCRDGEFSKGMELYKQAYAYMLKAKQNLPEDTEIAAKVESIKGKYQEAKKNQEIIAKK